MNNQLVVNHQGEPGWDDNEATFEMTIVSNNLHGDFQLANGYGYEKAQEVLMVSERALCLIIRRKFLYYHEFKNRNPAVCTDLILY